MKHYNVRVTVDMLPKGLQRAGRDKQGDALRKLFKKTCGVCGIFREMSEREYYVKPGEKRRKAEKLKKAIARGEIVSRDNEGDYEVKFDEYNF